MAMSRLQIPNKTSDKPFVLLALNTQTKAEGFIQKSSRSLIRLRVFFCLYQNRSWPAFFRPMASWSMASWQWPLGQPPVHGCLKVQTKRQTFCLEDLSGLEFSTFWFSGLVLGSTQKLRWQAGITGLQARRFLVILRLLPLRFLHRLPLGLLRIRRHHLWHSRFRLLR